MEILPSICPWPPLWAAEVFPAPSASHPAPRREGEEKLSRHLSSEKIVQFAREKGCVERERTIRPVPFLWVLDFGVELHRHLQPLKERYFHRTRLLRSYPGFHLRFTPEISTLLKRRLEYALAELAHESGRELDPKLAMCDIVIQDSTVVCLHASRVTEWPAPRSRKFAAGGEVDTLVIVRSNRPKSLALVVERTANIQLLKVGAWVRNSTLLLDLGDYASASWRTSPIGVESSSRARRRASTRSSFAPSRSTQARLSTSRASGSPSCCRV